MSRPVPILGAILAGGESRRYGGEPKALKAIGGNAIIERAIAAMREAVDRIVLVANDRSLYEPLGLPIRSDVIPGVGVLGGLLTALAWAEEDGCIGALVAACDMPFLSAGLLARLTEEATSEVVVAPASESRRGLEPLCAFYGVGCRPAIENALDRGDRHIVSFFPDVEVRSVPLDVVKRFGDPELLFLNVNTPDDMARARAALASINEPSS